MAGLVGIAVAILGNETAQRFGRVGSVVSALALVALAASQELFTFGLALAVVEIASALVLYDAAFAAIAQTVGAGRARRAITQITLFGGFASTIFWPLTHVLLQSMDWRSVYLAFAAIQVLVCLPIHVFAIGRPLVEASGADKAGEPVRPDEPPTLPRELHLQAMAWLVTSFCLSGFVFSAINVHWVSALEQTGVTAATAVAAGALMGPAQVGIRLLDMVIGPRVHPLMTAAIAAGLLLLALAVLMLSGASPVGVAAFAIFFGLGQGLTSIVRGTVPLALFGRAGYGARLGKIAAIRLVVTSVAPFVFAMAVGISPWIAFGAAAALSALSLAALLFVPRQGPDCRA